MISHPHMSMGVKLNESGHGAQSAELHSITGSPGEHSLLQLQITLRGNSSRLSWGSLGLTLEQTCNLGPNGPLDL